MIIDKLLITEANNQAVEKKKMLKVPNLAKSKCNTFVERKKDGTYNQVHVTKENEKFNGTVDNDGMKEGYGKYKSETEQYEGDYKSGFHDGVGILKITNHLTYFG